MADEHSGSNAIEAKSLIEKVSELTSVAVLEASRAVEAEMEAMKQMEAAYRSANDAAAAVRQAIRSEAAAKTELSQAGQRAREALTDAKKVGEIEARAEKEAKRRSEKLKAVLANVTKAVERGKTPNLTARDQARGQAEEAERRATQAHREADQVREALAAAERDVEDGKKKAVEASAWIRTCKGEEAAAWGKVAHTEDDGKKAMIAARQALKSQTGAKQSLDLTIRKLKSFMRDEARAAQAAETAETRPGREHQEAQTETVPVGGALLNQAEGATRRRTKAVHLEWSVSSIASRPYRGAAGAIAAPAHSVARKLKALTHLAGGTGEVRQTAVSGARLGVRHADEAADAVSGTDQGAPAEPTVGQQTVELSGSMVTLLIKGPTDLARVKRLRTQLEQAGDCRVKSVAGSSSGGTSIAAQVDQATSLTGRLRELDFVEWVSEKGKDVEVTLKPFTETAQQPEQSASSVTSPSAPLADQA